MTATCDHEHSEAVMLAAQWLAEQMEPPRPVVPNLRRAFGLSAPEACEACALAQTYRMNRRASN